MPDRPAGRPGTDAISRTELASGIRVVTERMPEARSATLGFWVGVGSRDEPAELAGASHFLEHLLFKGTERRSARDIAEAVDSVGGEMNAFTAKEHTGYWARLPAGELGAGLALLSDVLTDPALRPAEVDAERQVILEELAMDADDPDDLVHTLLDAALFPDHPLGREVAGDVATITAMRRDDIAGFFERWYRPANLVVAAAGDLHHADVVDGVAACFAGRDVGVAPERHAPVLDPVPLTVKRTRGEQAHVAVGWRGVARDDPDRFAVAVLDQVLGGGMASRMFQEIREDRGLAYSVFSGASFHADAGVVSAYVATAPGRSPEALRVLTGIVDDLLADGITDRELEVARGYLQGSLVLGLEDSGSRMARLAGYETARRDLVSIDEQVARIGEVTTDDVHRVVRRVLGGPRSVAAVGPIAAGRLAKLVA
ncbi:MAG TPA: pitrilysin family protein [Acidimicrobiales bacterium]|nr:pitrilysin family protein [Acidimicrobiales bacterium]